MYTLRFQGQQKGRNALVLSVVVASRIFTVDDWWLVRVTLRHNYTSFSAIASGSTISRAISSTTSARVTNQLVKLSLPNITNVNFPCVVKVLRFDIFFHIKR